MSFLSGKISGVLGAENRLLNERYGPLALAHDLLTDRPTPAAFVMCRLPSGNFAGCTRIDGRHPGLPGGMLRLFESFRSAAIREAYEEGWDVGIGAYYCKPPDHEPFFSVVRNGRLIKWFRAYEATPLENYREKARGIRQVELTEEELSKEGLFDNDRALAAYKAKYEGGS